MFNKNKKVVPIKGSASPSRAGSGQLYQGLPKVPLPLEGEGEDGDEHGDHDEFERQMNIEMDMFGEDMHAHGQELIATSRIRESGGGQPGEGACKFDVSLSYSVCVLTYFVCTHHT